MPLTLHNIPYRNIRATVSRSALALTGASLALQVGCGPTDRASAAPESGLLVEPAALTIGPLAIGLMDGGYAELTNPDAVELTVRFELAEPDDSALWGLELDPELVEVDHVLPAHGGSLELAIYWAPASGSAIDTAVLVTEGSSGELLLEVPVLLRVDPDGDDDGDAHLLAGGGDCDDQDPDIGPSTAEIWYDGVDQDCDGNDDDADGDGVEVGIDCDDDDHDVFPGNTEIWYDGVDQDCDGNDDDADGDGVAGGEDGPDCDDEDAGIYPGATDLADGRDQDCDGITDEDGVSAGSVMFSELFPENDYKTGTSDEFLEFYMNVSAGLDGWVLSSTRGSGTLVQLIDDPGSWLLVCSEGLALVEPQCAVSVDPWPVMSRGEETLSLTAAGAQIDQVGWDATWDLGSGSLQLDAGRAATADEAANDSVDAWCRVAPTPGTPNSGCP